MDISKLYMILYALAAKDGRDQALFGPNGFASFDTFQRSCPCGDFPEVWFELPLTGDPWFDLHVLTARESLDEHSVFSADSTGGYPNVFSWFSAQGKSVRQLALSWDIGSGDADTPAVQLLLAQLRLQTTCDFLRCTGRQDAVDAYKTFIGRLPENWFACYTGVFPSRPGHNMRVECIPARNLQKAYAQDPELLERHLHAVGMSAFGDTLLPRCQQLADTPFALEFQFDVDTDGCAGPMFGASLRFASPPGTSDSACYDDHADAGVLMKQIESWGLADERWHMLSNTAFAIKASFEGEHLRLYCYPAFIKLRWRDGEPVDAKAYLIAGAQ